MREGTKVRIVEDEYPELVGQEGVVTRIGPDGTTAWFEGGEGMVSGVWCSVSALEEVEG